MENRNLLLCFHFLSGRCIGADPDAKEHKNAWEYQVLDIFMLAEHSPVTFRFLISLVCLLACFPAALDAGASVPEADYVVRVWDARQGLPVDAVRAIAQTPDGYLWVGTFGGLARFDGGRFQVFDVGNTPELPNNLINALFCDRRGRLWIGHDSGQVSVLEGRKIQRVSLPPDPQRISIRGFGEDAEGNIWVLNASWKLFFITPAGQVISAPPANFSDSMLHLDSSAPDWRLRAITTQGQCFLVDRHGFTPDTDSPATPTDGRRVIWSASGGYWALHEKHLSRWRGGKPVEDAGEVDWGESIFAITCEWNGMVAAGTFRQGLNLVGRDGTRRRFDDRSGLPSSWVSVLFADAAGTLWVGTGDGGLAAIWPKRVWMATPPGEAARKHIQSVTPGAAGGIWAATEGAGLFHYNENSWRQSPDIPGASVPVYSSVLMSHEGRLWVVSPGYGISYLQGGDWHSMTGIPKITGARGGLLMQDGNVLWAATTEGLFRFAGENFSDVKQISAHPGISCLAEDGAGGIWLGGFGTGLWHRRADQTQVLLREQDGLPSENLLSLCRTRDGSLWIGTDGAGLARWKDGRFAVISRQHGLPSATISQMTEDADGRLWMGTYNGICAVSVEELNACAEGRLEHVKCLVLDAADGMESQECSAACQPAVCRTADGQLWFAMARGVAVVSPAGIKLNTKPPPVWIEQVKTDAGVVALGKPDQSIHLPAGQRRLQIAFNAPCLRAAHRVRFKHRLEPVESKWIDSTDSREAVYARVSPGGYTFRVIACNEDGVWNQAGAAVSFTVPPFLWERAWFAPLCWAGGAMAVAAVVLVTMRHRLKLRLERLEHQRAVERERSRIAKDLHDDLGGSLTEINMLAAATKLGASPATLAEENLSIIAKKSNRIVCALDEIVWAINPKHDSAASLADYLSGTSQEFLAAAGISLRLDVQRNLSAIPLSPECRHELLLAVKESLNNVVRHSQATEAWLRFKVAAGRLRIVVEDNGRGFNPATTLAGGDGLENLRARLGGVGGTCRIVSRPGGGTVVELEIPVA